MPPEAETDDTDVEALDPAENEVQAEPVDSPEAVNVAALMGWKPKDQWKGDTSGWKSATDFLRETPEILRNTRKTNERLTGQMARVVGEVAKLSMDRDSRMSADAEARLRAAVEGGDSDGAAKILKEVQATRPPDESPAFTDFKERNADWWETNDEATAYASVLDARYAKGGITDQAAHMKKVEDGVKKAFPDLFTDAPKPADEPQGRRAPLVARGNRTDTPANPADITAATLSRAERDAAKTMGVTLESYAKEKARMAANEKQRA